MSTAQQQALEVLDRERGVLKSLQQRHTDLVNKREDVSAQVTHAQEKADTTEVEDIITSGDASAKARKVVTQLQAQLQEINRNIASLSRALELQRKTVDRCDHAFSETVREFLCADFEAKLCTFADLMCAAARAQVSVREIVAVMNARRLEHPLRDAAFTWHELAFHAQYANVLTPIGVSPNPAVVYKKFGSWLDKLKAYGLKVEAGRQDKFALADGNSIGVDYEIRNAFAAGEARNAEVLAPKIGAAERLAGTTRDLLRRLGL